MLRIERGCVSRHADDWKRLHEKACLELREAASVGMLRIERGCVSRHA